MVVVQPGCNAEHRGDTMGGFQSLRLCTNCKYVKKIQEQAMNTDNEDKPKSKAVDSSRPDGGQCMKLDRHGTSHA